MIDLLADLGVTLLLFAVGLHLDIRRLLRREVADHGLHSLLMVGIGVGFLTGLSALGVAEASGLDLRGLALVALALSFSSTVFVVKVLDERNESRSRYGQIAIGVLVVQDVFAVVFVAVSQGSPPSPWAFALLLLDSRPAGDRRALGACRPRRAAGPVRDPHGLRPRVRALRRAGAQG